MEYVLPNILTAAEFDKTAKCIVYYGFDSFVNLFKRKVILSESSCWEYVGAKNSDGYSVQKIRSSKHKLNKTILAHRASWLLANRKIVSGFVLDHKCKNRSCVNPLHLQQITASQNTIIGSGITTINKNKKFCIDGHEFNEENTYFRKYNPNYRRCKICDKLKNAKRVKENRG